MSVYTYDKDTVSFHRTLYSYGRRQQMRSINHSKKTRVGAACAVALE